jgi:hypothetical protein
MGEGLVVYFGFRLERAPEGEALSRLQACLELSRPTGQSGGLYELEGAVLWVGARDAGGNDEDLGRGLLSEVRARVQKALALAATDGPLPAAAEAPAPAPPAQRPSAQVVQETYGSRRMRERAAAEPARAAPAAPAAPEPRAAAQPAAAAGTGKKNVDPPPEPPPKKPKGRLIDPDV